MTDSKTVKLTEQGSASNDNIGRNSAILPWQVITTTVDHPVMRTPSHSSPDGHRDHPCAYRTGFPHCQTI